MIRSGVRRAACPVEAANNAHSQSCFATGCAVECAIRWPEGHVEMTDPELKRRWYEFSLRGISADCKRFIRFAIFATPIDSEPQRFQFSLRGMLLVVALLALSFGLMKRGLSDYSVAGLLWFLAGLNIIAGTIGATIERLCDSRRRGTVGAILSMVSASLFLWFLVWYGSHLQIP